MSVCLDASVVVPLFVKDALADQARRAILRTKAVLILSDLASAEFISAIGRRLRAGELTLAEAREAIALLDTWAATIAEVVETTAQDFAACTGYLRRLDLPLRTPDGLHIAIASRLGASLLSFDKQLIASAKKLGVAVERV